jgi:hypothetical protein
MTHAGKEPPMIRAIDHLVILVEDLAAASADYAALGFTVAPGGEHADGATHNALVVFADGTYLELIAFRRPAPEHRWWRHVAAGAGLIDFALLPDAIEADVAAARERGLRFGEPRPGGRLRPDGQRVAWQIALPETPDLPFLCGDVTPRSLRVPGGAARQHPNGVTGIADVVVAAADPGASAERYRDLLGVSGAGPSFALGAGRIVLASASEPTARARLAARGEGPCALRLRSGSVSAGPLDPARTHGAPIDLVRD